MNSGFLSVVETDASGNFLDGRNYQTTEIGKSAHQREAIRGDVVKAIVARCLATRKPLVLEALDFVAKKRELKHRSPNVKRKLASLAYKGIYDLFCARARDAGVLVFTVNPAYTSTQGWLRYAAKKGWSVHIAAAGVIARRGQGFSEVAPTAGTLNIPVDGIAVELKIPEEISKSDVSCRWAVLHRLLTQAIASHYRSRRRVGSPSEGDAAVSGETPELKPGLTRHRT